MKHSELNELWRQQEDRFSEWRDELRKRCMTLRDAFIAEIQPPASKWKDPGTGEEHPYVGLIYLNPERTPLKGHIPSEALTDDGELMFGLSVTFDRGPGTFPKETIYLSLAVRFADGEAEFSFLDTDAQQPDTPPGWVSDVPKFVSLIVQRIADYVKLDPFNGPRAHSGIGFL